MRRYVVAQALACLFLPKAAPVAQIPKRLVGRQFTAWLDAFNSGDRERIRKYLAENYPSANSIGRFEVATIARPTGLASSQLPESEIVKALRAKPEREAATDRFAGAVLLARLENGRPRVVFSGAYGLADRERSIANKLDTRFRVGSMNKMFTAVSILQLAQAGLIKLSDPVGKYIRDYPNRDVATKVTIHQLLTHTGGTGDFFGPEFSAHRLELKTLDDYVKLLGARGPAFELGTGEQVCR